MNFTTAGKSPIVVTIDGTKYPLRRMVGADWVAWAADLDAERLAAATADLTPESRARLLMVFPVQPCDDAELSRRICTPDGKRRIIRTCAAGIVPADVLARLLDGSHERDLETLAMLLASVVDPDVLAAATRAAPAPDQEGDENPLPPPPASESSG